MEKKYKAIVKVNNEQFVKYHVNNLLAFTKFLDTRFPEWRYFNVYGSNGSQLANYTNKNRPITKYI